MHPDWSNYTLATFNQTLLYNSSDLCTLQTCPLKLDGEILAQMSYLPNLAGNVLFAAIFGLLLILQIGLGIRYRTWGYMVGMVGGGILEVVGYIGRIQMHFNPFPQGPFIMYLCGLTIGPAFYTASIYLCLSRIMTIYAPEAARFKPRVYTYTFITFDFFALVLQAAGGGIASTADTHSLEQAGIHLMVAGVAWQVVSLSIFAALCLDYYFAVRRLKTSNGELSLTNDFYNIRTSRSHKGMLIALVLATLFIYVRSVFRCAELDEGFSGPLANSQVTFMILEGVMVILANILLTVFHPGLVWGHGAWKQAQTKPAEVTEKKTGSLRFSRFRAGSRKETVDA